MWAQGPVALCPPQPPAVCGCQAAPALAAAVPAGGSAGRMRLMCTKSPAVLPGICAGPPGADAGAGIACASPIWSAPRRAVRWAVSCSLAASRTRMSTGIPAASQCRVNSSGVAERPPTMRFQVAEPATTGAAPLVAPPPATWEPGATVGGSRSTALCPIGCRGHPPAGHGPCLGSVEPGVVPPT